MADLGIKRQILAAVRADDSDTFRKLIRTDSERLSIVTSSGSWLHYAANFDKFGVVEVLVEEMGVDVNEGLYESGPLCAAASNGHTKIVRYLLDRNARLDVSDPVCNPLFGAIYGGHTEVVRILLDAGIDPDIRYSGTSMENMDALAFAREWGKKDIEKLLLADRRRRGVPDNHATGRK